jgi:hypothetical protein
MKRFILIAVLAGALAALLAGTALAAGPVTPPAQGFGQGMGMHAPGTGMMTPGTGMGPGGMTGRGAPAWAGQPEEVATLLGMTAEQIQAERLAGKSLLQIATSKNLSEDKLISTILDAKKADLAALVADGKLTQPQMDLMVEHMQTQIKTIVERTTVGPMQGRQGMGQMQSGMGRGRAGMGQMQPGMGRSGMGQGLRGGRGANQ